MGEFGRNTLSVYRTFHGTSIQLRAVVVTEFNTVPCCLFVCLFACSFVRSGGGRSERYTHGGGGGGGGREMNGRNSHGGGHGGHGGGNYGGRGAVLSREQTRPPPVQSSTQFDSRNHKEIVDFFQHNFDIIKDQTLSGSGHKSNSTRKAVYYQPPQGTARPPAVASEAGLY